MPHGAPAGVPPKARLVAPWLPWALIAIGVLVDLLVPSVVTLSSLFAAAPLIAAPFLTAPVTLSVGGVATAAHALLAFTRSTEVAQEAALRTVNVAVLSLVALGINFLARRSTAKLATVRTVAEAAQRAVLPPPPRDVGELRIAARYEAAQAEARIGGDLFALQRTPFGVRMLVGDVRGNGMQAVELLAVVIGAFREAAEQEPTLSGVARRLERALLRQAELRPGAEVAENFVTAVLAELPTGRWDVLRLVNCGHPPPLLQRADGTVRVLEPSQHTLPLGMGVLLEEEQDRAVDEEEFPRGGILLMYTDGVSEARNERDVFFDPEAWLNDRRFDDPETLLGRLVGDVTAYAGGQVADDMALMAVLRRPAFPS